MHTLKPPFIITLPLSLVFITAFAIRALTFACFIQPHERYKQPDSGDYHNCALSIALGFGMHRPDTHEPIFWRTPGYPLYLAPFYHYYGITSTAFSENTRAHIAALWLQLFLCSCIPLIIFFLALQMTHNLWVSQAAAWITVFHPGMVLASTFLLTEGLSMIFFYLFLLFFYQALSRQQRWERQIILAAIMLGIMTWMRPMGEFVAIVSGILLLFFNRHTMQQALHKIALFFIIFALMLAPWYIRNYKLTGHFFFCPMSGAYLNTFIAPKIMRDLTHKPLTQCMSYLYNAAMHNVEKEIALNMHTGYYISKERVCATTAWPLIIQHPFLALYHWIAQVIKTMFDLYCYQLTAIAAGTFSYDPPEEFLSEKITACLYKQSMPLWMRSLCWLELLYALMVWIGLVGGFWIFVIRPLFQSTDALYTQKMGLLWTQTVPLIIALIGMTGGFGYARLRLPVEPLMIILALTYYMNGKRLP